MRVAIHQPNFMPWRGWFTKLMQADVMILLDDVQFERGGWTNRTRILKNLLTVPVCATDKIRIHPIKDVDTANGGRWKRKMRETLRHTYGKTTGWEIVEAWFSPEIHNVLDEPNLVSMNVRLLTLMADVFEIETPMIWASQMRDEPWPATAGLVQLLTEVEATTYLCGIGSERYQQDELLTAHGISVRRVKYQKNDGYQTYGLSAIDTICHHPRTSREKLEAFAV